MYSTAGVMDTLIVKDNFPGDGADMSMTTWQYDKGYYDRIERVFYGFAIVNEKHHYTENSNAIYRKYNRYYYNNNFYYKGLLLTEEVRNGGDSLYMVSMNRYSHHTLTNRENAQYATLDTTVICYYEGTGSADIRQEKTFRYETTYGNVTQQTETSTDMPVVTANISYHVSRRHSKQCGNTRLPQADNYC